MSNTISEWHRVIAERLKGAGVAEAPRVANLILQQATGLSPEQLILKAGDRLSAEAQNICDQVVARACAHEPLSRIVRRREFYGREFTLNEATLDPRPDTETLIDAVLELCDEGRGRAAPYRLLDIGTGTGCLAISLLAELQNATALATDISNRALEAASKNARIHGVGDRAKFENHDVTEGVTGRFDIIVSNPPYIPTDDINNLARSVKDFDPHMALDGGSDGLDVYRRIIAGLPAICPEGWVVFEVGAGQAGDVANLLTRISVSQVRTWDDLLGHTRCVAARTQCG